MSSMTIPQASTFSKTERETSSSPEIIMPPRMLYSASYIVDETTQNTEKLTAILVYQADFNGDGQEDEQLVYRQCWEQLQNGSVNMTTEILFPTQPLIANNALITEMENALLRTENLNTNLFTVIHQKIENTDNIPARGTLNARSMNEKSGLIFGYCDDIIENAGDSATDPILTLDFCYENQWFVYHQE